MRHPRAESARGRCAAQLEAQRAARAAKRAERENAREKGSASNSPRRRSSEVEAESAETAKAVLHHAREMRDQCQDNLLAILNHREYLLSRKRDLERLESALLGPLDWQTH